MNTYLTQSASNLRRGARQQRGVALITVLLVLLILTAIAFGLMYMANTETMINANFRSVQSSFAASQAGLQEARERLMSTNAVPHLILGPAVLPGNPNSILYLVNPTPGDGVIDPTNAASKFFDDQFCRENFGLGLAQPAPGQPCAVGPPAGSVSIPSVQSDAPFNSTAAALPYKWVRITAKSNLSECNSDIATCVAGNVPGAPTAGIVSAGQPNNLPICWDGSHELPLPAGYASCAAAPPAGATAFYKPVYVVTSFALTAAGARRMTQMEVAEMPPIITNAALDTEDFVNTSGASVTVNGYDNCQCSCPPAVGGAAPICTNRVTGAACTGSTFAVFTTQQVSTSGNPVIIAGPNPPTAQNQTNFPYDIPALVSMYSTAPGAVSVTGAPYSFNCSGGSCGTQTGNSFGTPPTGFPTFAPPAPGQLAPGEVDQITVVPGSVTLSNHTQGAGVLVVQGDLTVQGGLDFYGLIIVTGRFIIRGSGQGQNTNLLGSVLAGQGTSADVISGGVNLQYDQCALSHNRINQPPAVLAFRELAY